MINHIKSVLFLVLVLISLTLVNADVLTCEGADYVFDVDMGVMGDGCHHKNKTTNSTILNVNKGEYLIYGKIERGNPGQCQTNEDFFLEVNGLQGPETQDDEDSCAITTRIENLGIFNLNSGDNEIFMKTAAHCPPDTTANSVDLIKICLFKQAEEECETDKDCGEPHCAGGINYCFEGNIYQDFLFPKCINPGEQNAYCSYETILPWLLQECEYGCSLGTCLEEPEEGIDQDGDGYNETTDCNDNNPLINPGMTENCSTSYDDNCDGRMNENCNHSNITPPASITNLKTVFIQKTSIKWNWTNPADQDFYQNLIYLDGKNILNTSSNYYKATGLDEDTAYTIEIYTMDNSSNINWIEASSSAKTLKDDEDEDDEEDNSESINFYEIESTPTKPTIANNTSPAITLKGKTTPFNWTPWLIGLFILLILILLILIIQLIRK